MNLVPSALLFLFLTGNPAEPTSQERPFETVTVIDHADLAVRLLVKMRPSLADRDWLTLEFINRGKKPIAIDTAHYSIHCVTKGLQDKKLLLQTVLTSGNSRDLFPATWKPGAGPAIVLQPGGTYRVSEHLSDFGSHALGLPPRGGLDVDCTLKMLIRTSDRQNFQSPQENLKFAFEWATPDETGLKAIRDRLKHMLQNPVDALHHHYLLSSLLGTETIANAVSRDELLTALKLRSARLDGRYHIADTLVKKHDAMKEVLAFYGDRLRAKEVNALNDVHHLGLWSPTFIPAVVEFYSKHSDTNSLVLDVLHQHRADWIQNKEEVGKLLARIKVQHPVLDKAPNQLEGENLEKWAKAVRELSLVGDHTVIPLLRPGLADKRIWWRLNPLAARSVLDGPPSPLIRVCDSACDAITAILDDKVPKRTLSGRPLNSNQKLEKQTEDEFIAECDAMIERLHRRLAAPDKGEKKL